VRIDGLTTIDAAASCQAFLLLGYDQGVMSGLVGANNEFGKQFNHPDANMQGICTLPGHSEVFTDLISNHMQ